MVELSQQSRVEPPLSVRAEYAPFVNFAMQQNAVPLLSALVVTNFSDKQATDDIPLGQPSDLNVTMLVDPHNRVVLHASCFEAVGLQFIVVDDLGQHLAGDFNELHSYLRCFPVFPCRGTLC